MPRVEEPVGVGSTLPLRTPAPAPSALGGKSSGAAATVPMTAEPSWNGQTPAPLGSWHGRSVPGVIPAAALLASDPTRAGVPQNTAAKARRRAWPIVLTIVGFLLVAGVVVALVVVFALER